MQTNSLRITSPAPRRAYVHYFRFDAERTSTEYVEGITLPLAPFLGVMAVEPAGRDPVSAILAGRYGGNLVTPTRPARRTPRSRPRPSTGWSPRASSRPSWLSG